MIKKEKKGGKVNVNSHHNNAVLSDCAKPGDLGGYGGVGVTYHDGPNID